MAKFYEVKVYDQDNNYLTTWKDVVSDIQFNNEINSAGGQLKFTLARNAGDYGEGTDVDFGNRIKVYVFDKEQDTGLLLFQGYISGYNPIYKDENVEVTVLSYGAELNDYILEGGESIVTSQSTQTSTFNFGNASSPSETLSVAQSFTAPTTHKISRMEIYAETVDFYNISTGLNEPRTNVACKAYLRSGSTAGSGTLLGTSQTFYIQDDQLRLTNIIFNPAIQLTASSTYNIEILPLEFAVGSGQYMAAIGLGTGYSGGQFSYQDTGSTWYNDATKDWYFKWYEEKALTYAEYLSTDPGVIIKLILDKYASLGGTVTYNIDTIDVADTTVTYQYNVNTILEAINKCIELSPKDWYWYLDYGTNLVHFHEKSNTPDHTFSLEKDIIDAKFEKRIEDVVNTVYFTGGDTGGGVNLFKKYINQDSIDSYGVKAIKYSDSRVTNTSTADTIANSILETKSQPELRVVLEILDSNNEQGVGYDIETIKVGDVVAVRNITQQVGLSTWDYGKWDEAYWDYNIYNLSSLQMQIQKLDYNENSVTIHASTIPIDVTKRIDTINRNLQTIETVNNPTSPS
jgi:hypothetical protein